jgi:hypothetical protein
MSKRKTKPPAPLTDPLRTAIIESEIPLLRIAREADIARASLIRFRDGQTSLRLDVADRLAAFFGLALVTRKGK